MRIHHTSAAVVAAIALLTACTDHSRWPNGVDPNAPTVLSVAPASASVGVNAAASVTVTFNRSMMAGMETRVVLHQGTITGPAVAASASWSIDRTVLTLTPSAMLTPGTLYLLHFSPALTSTGGQFINLGACASIGGQYVSSAMMGVAPGGGMMNGTWGPGMMSGGWRSADGDFGMFFTFTTA